MPTGVYNRTKETRKKMSLRMKGNKITLGRKQSKEEVENRVKQFRDKDHWNWKGDKAGYRAIHIWVENRLGKPNFCQNCGDKKLGHRSYHWANIGHTYKKILTDWRRLCVKCHKAFDRENQESH